MIPIRNCFVVTIIANGLWGCAVPRNNVEFSTQIALPTPSNAPVAPWRPDTSALATAEAAAQVSIASGAIGHAEANQSPPAEGPQSRRRDIDQAAGNYLNLMPMSSLRETDAVLKTAVNYSDRYTRIVVVAHRGCADLRASQRCSQPPQQQIGQDTGATPTTYASMGYEKTPFLVRYFSQPRRSIALSANLSAGAFVATVPIMTITHSGDSNGDAWARTEYSQVQQMPWFLVRSDGSNSVLSTRFTLSATESIQFQGAVIGLNAAVSLARVLAPQGALVTTLTESGEKARAQALDNTLSSLFAMNIAEQHWSDADIRRWRRGYGLEIHVSIPPESGNLTDQVQPVGNWIVTLDNPRQSIFSDIRSCVSENDQDCDAEADAAITKQILKTVKAADVLSFNLIPLTSPNTTLGTVGTYISQHDGFSTGLASMSAAGAKGATDAKQLCRNIRSWTSSAGFSSLDQDIILWAIATGMPSVPAPTGKMLLTACNDDNLKNLPAPT